MNICFSKFNKSQTIKRRMNEGNIKLRTKKKNKAEQIKSLRKMKKKLFIFFIRIEIPSQIG